MIALLCEQRLWRGLFVASCRWGRRRWTFGVELADVSASDLIEYNSFTTQILLSLLGSAAKLSNR